MWEIDLLKECLKSGFKPFFFLRIWQFALVLTLIFVVLVNEFQKIRFLTNNIPRGSFKHTAQCF